jgi:fluoroquinolone transport system ATP-binding protein
LISVKELFYTYPSNSEATVKGISFNVSQGEILGFLGPSGAGKSTTQKILIKLLKGYQGEVRIMDKELSQWKNDFYNHIGVGFELPNHYSKLSALENLQFFSAFYERKTTDLMLLLEKVGLKDFANKRVSEFSKGMKMRLNFIRALLHDPEIIFLDEPTSGLDPVNAQILKSMIQELKNQGKTIFITTHHMHDAEELCDRVAFMVDGQLKVIDTPKALKIQGSSRKVKVEYNGSALQTVEFPLDGLGENPQFQQLLKEQKIESIHTTEASLNDVFIKVTGKSLT